MGFITKVDIKLNTYRETPFKNSRYDIVIEKENLDTKKVMETNTVSEAKYDIGGGILIYKIFEDSDIIFIKDRFIYKIDYINNTINIKYCIIDENYKDMFIDVLLTEILAVALKKINVFTIHAGLIENKGKYLLILGDGGTGKSSFIVSCCTNGAKFLSDDMVVLKIIDGCLYAHAGHPFFKLWNDSAKAVLLDKYQNHIGKIGDKLLYSCNEFNKYIPNWIKIDFIVKMMRSLEQEYTFIEIKGIEKYKQLIKAQISGFSNNSRETVNYISLVNHLKNIVMVQALIKHDLEHINFCSNEFLKQICGV